MGAAAGLWVTGVLVLGAVPAAGRTAGSTTAAVAPGSVDLASLIDLDGFEARAAAWTEASSHHRAVALARADELAALTKAAEVAAEEAEEARLAAAEAEQARLAAEEAARVAAEAATTTTTTTSTTTTTTPTSGEDAGNDPLDEESAPEGSVDDPVDPVAPAGDPTAEQWRALRECESSNNYQAVSADGRYRGAYQFSIPTWDWLAGLRYPELVGVDPVDASPADQDKMGLALFEVHGISPWPTCGSVLL